MFTQREQRTILFVVNVDRQRWVRTRVPELLNDPELRTSLKPVKPDTFVHDIPIQVERPDGLTRTAPVLSTDLENVRIPKTWS